MHSLRSVVSQRVRSLKWIFSVWFFIRIVCPCLWKRVQLKALYLQNIFVLAVFSTVTCNILYLQHILSTLDPFLPQYFLKMSGCFMFLPSVNNPSLLWTHTEPFTKLSNELHVPRKQQSLINADQTGLNSREVSCKLCVVVEGEWWKHDEGTATYELLVISFVFLVTLLSLCVTIVSVTCDLYDLYAGWKVEKRALIWVSSAFFTWFCLNYFVQLRQNQVNPEKLQEFKNSCQNKHS